MTIFHIAHAGEWRGAATAGEYRGSTRGATLDEVGFIHCSLAPQVTVVADTFYRDDADDLVVLVIDETGLDVRLEDSGTGEFFPHLYGALPVGSVTDVRPARFTADGFEY